MMQRAHAGSCTAAPHTWRYAQILDPLTAGGCLPTKRRSPVELLGAGFQAKVCSVLAEFAGPRSCGAGRAGRLFRTCGGYPDPAQLRAEAEEPAPPRGGNSSAGYRIPPHRVSAPRAEAIRCRSPSAQPTSCPICTRGGSSMTPRNRAMVYGLAPYQRRSVACRRPTSSEVRQLLRPTEVTRCRAHTC
jgi:hypothetical protein